MTPIKLYLEEKRKIEQESSSFICYDSNDFVGVIEPATIKTFIKEPLLKRTVIGVMWTSASLLTNSTLWSDDRLLGSYSNS